MNYSNTGVLWTNNYKKHDKAPDFKGDLTLERSLVKQLLSESEDDVKIRISGWNRDGKNGPFISLAYDSFKPKEEAKPEPRKAKQPDPVDDEDVPF